MDVDSAREDRGLGEDNEDESESEDQSATGGETPKPVNQLALYSDEEKRAVVRFAPLTRSSRPSESE